MLASGLIWVACLTLAEGAPPAAPPSYVKEIDPLLRRYCAGCHGKRMPRAQFSVIEYEDLFRTRKGKVMLVAGQPDKSILLQTMEGHKPVMPPRDQKLQPTKAEIARVRAWIAAGARDDTPPDPNP
jgi:hypothetical protein